MRSADAEAPPAFTLARGRGGIGNGALVGLGVFYEFLNILIADPGEPLRDFKDARQGRGALEPEPLNILNRKERHFVDSGVG